MGKTVYTQHCTMYTHSHRDCITHVDTYIAALLYYTNNEVCCYALTEDTRLVILIVTILFHLREICKPSDALYNSMCTIT